MAKMIDVKDCRAAWRSSGPGRLVLAAWMVGGFAPAVMGKEPVPGKEPPTFTKDVAPILQQKCQNCHRRHQVGPFALETYEQARKRAGDIATVAGERLMPPWKPERGVGPKLKHDQSLSREEIAILEAWAEAGAPQGDPRHMPPPPRFAEGWKLGTPDLVLEPAESFSIPASGPDTYRCFVIPTEPRAGHLHLGDRLPAGESSGRASHQRVPRHERRRAEAGRGRAGAGIHLVLGAGHRGLRGPELLGRRARAQPFPRGDRPAPAPPVRRDPPDPLPPHRQSPRSTARASASISRASRSSRRSTGAPRRTRISSSRRATRTSRSRRAGSSPSTSRPWPSPRTCTCSGTTCGMSVTSPNGRTQDLIHIPDWDPSWQSTYYFQKPIPLPRGSVVKVIAHFDNSAHLRNPNHPPKLVELGLRGERRDVRGLHRRREDGPGPDPSRRDRRPRRNPRQAAAQEHPQEDGQAVPLTPSP